MRIVEVSENKKQYLDLLLLADEQEDMVDRYLYKGKMYVLDDDGVKCECVVTDEGTGILEIKNIATVPPFQRKGYAKALIEFLVEKYRFGVSTSASGNSSCFNISTASSLISLAPLVATITGSTTMFSALYCFSFSAIT